MYFLYAYVRAEGLYVLWGGIEADNANINIKRNVYIGSLKLKDSELMIKTDMIGVGSLTCSGSSIISGGSAGNNNDLEVSFLQTSGNTEIDNIDLLVTECLSLTNANVTGTVRSEGNCVCTGTSSMTSLIIEGDCNVSYTGNVLNLTNLTISNISPHGVNVDGLRINVSGTLKNLKTVIEGGTNIYALAGASFADDWYQSDVSIVDHSLDGSVAFGGIVNLEGSSKITGSEFYCKGLIAETGSLDISALNCTVDGNLITKSPAAITMSEESTIDINGDMSVYTADWAGTVKLSGNLSAAGNNVQFGTLVFDGCTKQMVGGNYSVTTERLNVENTAENGVWVSSPVIVTGAVCSPDSVIIDGENISLEVGGAVIGEIYSGSIALKSAEISSGLEILGNLVAAEGLNVHDATLQVGGDFTPKSGSMTVGANGIVNIAGNLESVNNSISLAVNSGGRLYIKAIPHNSKHAGCAGLASQVLRFFRQTIQRIRTVASQLWQGTAPVKDFCEV